MTITLKAVERYFLVGMVILPFRVALIFEPVENSSKFHLCGWRCLVFSKTLAGSLSSFKIINRVVQRRFLCMFSRDYKFLPYVWRNRAIFHLFSASKCKRRTLCLDLHSGQTQRACAS